MEFSITLVIIIITVLVSLGGFSNQKMIDDLIFYPARMKGGRELHRFFTHGLIHANFFHLFVNMLTLYFFGPTVEHYILIKPLYIILYITALPLASIFDFIKNKDNYHYRSLGASGAVSAVIFSTIILDPWFRGICPYGICIPNIIFGALYVIYSVIMAKRGGDNVGHYAHLWGGVYGFVFTAIARPDLLKNFIDRLIHPSFG